MINHRNRGANMARLDLEFAAQPLPREAEALRAEVRGFLAQEREAGTFEPTCDCWLHHDVGLTRRIAQRGWIGLTWPERYGGGGRSILERFVVTEELLAAGAPVGAHWVADRQSGPLFLKFGTEEQKSFFLPRITRGECFFAIGLSEPGSGSDLASVRTRAVRSDGFWCLNGTKIWSSGAHRAHYMIVLCRTEPAGEDRHAGLSQLAVDLSAPGVTIRPIYNLAGEHHFNEVVFEDVEVPDERVVGGVGAGWRQVTSELAFERSGPERYMSIYPLFVELIRRIGPEPGAATASELGRLAARLFTLRQMSLSVNGRLQAGFSPDLEAALVKDVGTRFERDVPEAARMLAPFDGDGRAEAPFPSLLADALLHAPSFTLRGGTNEILRGLIARGLGLR